MYIFVYLKYLIKGHAIIWEARQNLNLKIECDTCFIFTVPMKHEFVLVT